MKDTNDAFFDIANELVSDEANDLLEKQMALTVQWRKARIANGESADLRDLINQVMAEPNKRGPVLSAYAAALQRLLKERGEW